MPSLLIDNLIVQAEPIVGQDSTSKLTPKEKQRLLALHFYKM